MNKIKHANIVVMIINIIFFSNICYSQIYANNDLAELKLLSKDNGKSLSDIYKIQNDTINSSSINQISNNSNINIRKLHMSFTGGFLEVVSLGFGYQYSEEWDFTVKAAGIIVPGRAFLWPSSGLGIGLRIAKYFPKYLIFNNISIQPTVLIQAGREGLPQYGLNGSSLEISFGNEGLKSSNLNIFWSVGAIVSTLKKEKPLYSPSLKLGVNWNL